MPTTVFLSYARADDEPFVRRLYEDLIAKDFDVWFDRESLPSRQLEFYPEIERAISGRERLLLIVGKAAAKSEYVKGEWRFALKADKHILPILRMGDFSDVPSELGFHCYDFRSDSAYDACLKRVIDDLLAPPPPLGDLIRVPELPQQYVPRTDLLTEAKEKLRELLRKPEKERGRNTSIGIHGMGGLGKSVLASALVHEPVVRRFYKDGICWFSIGQEPDLPLLRQQFAALIGEPVRIDPEAALNDGLRERSRTKAMLVVLDDVWDVDVVEAFNFLGPGCRLLVTTRDVELLHKTGSIVVPAALFTEAEALALLAKAMDVGRHELPAEAVDVVSECGRLPLAIALCGGMARRRNGDLSGILQRLQQADLEGIAERHPLQEQHRNIAHVIQMSMDALTEEERHRFTELTVFPVRRPIQQSSARLFWEHMAEGAPLDAEDILLSFYERSLLTAHDDGPRKHDRAYAMHDLIRDHATRIAGDPKALHARFADAVLDLREREGTEFKGTIREQLPWHLAQAGDYQRLLDVLADRDHDYFHQWAEQGSAIEGRQCLEFLLNELEKQDRNHVLLSGLATQLARLSNRLGDVQASDRWLRYATEHGDQAVGGDLLRSVVLHERGSQALYEGKLMEAADHYRGALDIAHKISPPSCREMAANLCGLAVATYLDSGRVDRTIRLSELALKCAEQVDDAVHAAEACRMLGDVYKDDLQHDRAEEYLQRGLKYAGQAQLSAARMQLLTALGWSRYQKAALGKGTMEEAKSVFDELRSAAEQVADRRVIADAWCGLGQCALQMDDDGGSQLAIDHLRAPSNGELPEHLKARLGLFIAARLYRAGRYNEAATTYRAVGEMAQQHGLWSRRVDALLGMGASEFREGRAHEAETHWLAARDLLGSCPRVRTELTERFLRDCKFNAQLCVA